MDVFLPGKQCVCGLRLAMNLFEPARFGLRRPAGGVVPRRGGTCPDAACHKWRVLVKKCLKRVVVGRE
jgi:hypothetical protein